MNSVQLGGKVASVSGLRYSPSGLAVLELLVSVPQQTLGKKSHGRVDVLVTGDRAAALEGRVRIGTRVSVLGTLWVREFRHKTGVLTKEIKVMAEEISVLDTQKVHRAK